MRVLWYIACTAKTKIENSSINFFFEITSTETIGGQKAAVTGGGPPPVRQGYQGTGQAGSTPNHNIYRFQNMHHRAPRALAIIL